MVKSTLCAFAVMMTLAGCADENPVVRGTKAFVTLPPSWCPRDGTHIPLIRVGSSLELTLIPSDTRGYWRIDPRIHYMPPGYLQSIPEVSPEAGRLLPPYTTITACSADDFDTAQGTTLLISAGRSNSSPSGDYNFQGAPLVSVDPADYSCFHYKGGTATNGFRSFKIARLSPDWKYGAVSCSDKPVKQKRVLGLFNDEIFPGEEYIQLVDPTSGKPLGDAVRLAGRKGSFESMMLWSPDSKVLIVFDGFSLLHIFTVDELLFATQVEPDKSP
ncbi:hypothetical protein BH11PLA1_BH11PLA1_20600 [soil metagenome]